MIATEPEPGERPLTEAQREELDRRLDELEEDLRHGREPGVPWLEVLTRLRRH